MDKHTVVTRQAWSSRLGESLKGILVGLVLLVGGCILLWWNEGRAVVTAKGLAEGAGLVTAVPAGRVAPEHEGRLVHVAGRAGSGEVLADPDFPMMTVRGLVLRRQVEMYQWREKEQTKETKETGGSVVKETTYSYDQVWSSTLNDSSRFYDAAGHRNPASLPYADMKLMAADARLEAFRLSSGLLAQLPVTDTLRPPEAAALGPRQHPAQGRIYIGDNPDSPAVGDVRLQYTYAPEQEVSVVARQSGDGFTPFSVSDGKRSIQMLEAGLHDASAMFHNAQMKNQALTWVLRAVGWLVLFLGFYFVLRPLSVFGDLRPGLGSFLNVGVSLVSLILSAIAGLLVIALAWLFYRPVLGVLLLALAAAAAVGLKKLVNKRAAAHPITEGQAGALKS